MFKPAFKPVNKPELDTQQAFDCRATAALLRSVTPLVWASHVGVLLSRDAWPVLLCWLAGCYLAVRIHLDAGLFELLARDPAQAPGQLDDWLAAAGLRPSTGVERSVEERCQGARRLVRHFAIVWLVQMAALAVAMVRRTL